MLYSDAVKKPVPEDSFDEFPRNPTCYNTREELFAALREIHLGQNAAPPAPQQPFDQFMADFEFNFPIATSTPIASPIEKTENKENTFSKIQGNLCPNFSKFPKYWGTYAQFSIYSLSKNCLAQSITRRQQDLQRIEREEERIREAKKRLVEEEKKLAEEKRRIAGEMKPLPLNLEKSVKKKKTLKKQLTKKIAPEKVLKDLEKTTETLQKVKEVNETGKNNSLDGEKKKVEQKMKEKKSEKVEKNVKKVKKICRRALKKMKEIEHNKKENSPMLDEEKDDKKNGDEEEMVEKEMDMEVEKKPKKKIRRSTLKKVKEIEHNKKENSLLIDEEKDDELVEKEMDMEVEMVMEKEMEKKKKNDEQMEELAGTAPLNSLKKRKILDGDNVIVKKQRTEQWESCGGTNSSEEEEEAENSCYCYANFVSYNRSFLFGHE
ncbi:unnamed protein product [Caenorhabditis nigoni]